MGLSVFFALSQSNVQRLSHNNSSIHFSDGFGGFLGAGKADEAKAFAAAFLTHDLGGRDCTEGGEFLPKPFVVDGVVQILNVKVDSLVLVHALHLESFKLLFELSLAFSLLLGPTAEHSLAFNFFTIQVINCSLGMNGVFKADESKAF